MKPMTLVLALFLFVLSVLPCADTVLQPEQGETFFSVAGKCDGHGHGEDADHCSPFCVCQCCHAHAITVPMLHTVSGANFPVLTHSTLYKDFFVETYQVPLLQPPQA